MDKKIYYSIWGICAVFLILAIVVVAMFNGKHGQVEQKTYTVQAKEEQYYSGIVAPENKEAVSNKPLEQETLTSSSAKNGQKVTKGETLFTFNKDMSAEIASVNAEIQQLQSTNAQLQSTSSSTSGMSVDDQTLAAAGVDVSSNTASTDNSAEIQQNNSQIASDQSKLAQLNAEANRTVTAPISGTLIKDASGNYYVYSRPVIQGNVNEFDLSNIHNNSDVQVIKNNGSKMYGTITEKDKAPYNQSSSVSYYHFQVTADDNLTFGMHVQIKANSKGYKVPKDAVTDGQYVKVLKNGKTKKVFLTFTKSGDFYYVHSGIHAGEKLVLD